MVPVVVPGVVSVAAGVGLKHVTWPVRVKGSERLVLQIVTHQSKQEAILEVISIFSSLILSYQV